MRKHEERMTDPQGRAAKISLMVMAILLAAFAAQGAPGAQELEKKLASLLDLQFTKGAHVTVFIKEYQKVSIIGAVGRPGQYELVGPTTLLHAIAQAGGLTGPAMEELFVYRQGEKGRETRDVIPPRELTHG